MENKYYVVSVTASPSQLNDIDLLANELGCSGIEEFSMSEEQVDNLLGERSYSGGDVPSEIYDEVENHKGSNESHKYYFTGEEAMEYALLFKSNLDLKNDIDYKFEEFEEQDWNEEWRKNFHRIDIDIEMAVIPSWEDKVDIKFPLYIYPGQGFGTGNHETTFLCLKKLRELDSNLAKKSCMDFGCGSSILGIGAKKVGFKKVDLYDIDPLALENSKVNLDNNFPQNEIANFRLLLPKEKDKFETSYELVFANILAPVLKEYKEWLSNLTSRGGYLILSGILKEQVADLVDFYKDSGLELIDQETKNDWACLVYKK